jgi:hypothetical protein
MSDGGGDIIIKGGSCELYFDDAVFQKDQNDPTLHAHQQNYKITRIMISGDDTYARGFPEGFTGEIHIFCEP